MMETFCCWLLVLNLLFSLFVCVYRDFNGAAEHEPGGFPGFVGTIVTVGLLALIMYGAGIFSHLGLPL